MSFDFSEIQSVCVVFRRLDTRGIAVADAAAFTGCFDCEIEGEEIHAGQVFVAHIQRYGIEQALVLALGTQHGELISLAVGDEALSVA